MRPTDGRAITNPENAQSFSHAEIKQASEHMNPEELAGAFDTWTTIAAAVTTAGQQFESALRKAVDQRWEGAAAEAAVSGILQYATRVGELGDSLDRQSAPLEAAGNAAARFKAAIPDVPDGSNGSTAPEVRNAQEEQARDDMVTYYIQPYVATAPVIPTLPAPTSPITAGSGTTGTVPGGAVPPGGNSSHAIPGGTVTPENSGDTATPKDSGESATPGNSEGTGTPGNPGSAATPGNSGGTATPADSGTPGGSSGGGTPSDAEGTPTPGGTAGPATPGDSGAGTPAGQTTGSAQAGGASGDAGTSSATAEAGTSAAQQPLPPQAVLPQAVSPPSVSPIPLSGTASGPGSVAGVPTYTPFNPGTPQFTTTAPSDVAPAPSRSDTPASHGPNATPNPAAQPRPGVSVPAQPAAQTATPATPATAPGRQGMPGTQGYSGLMAARGRGEEDGEHRSPRYLRTEEHATELLGEVEPTVPPAIGAQ
ncbi:hypothetical protein [Nocardia sp. NPDC005366]|uniref:hypothetical protein n=1 Tax=Nocardia sp. NPDC005366 TaxID=3156878 RepID=UPI00339F3D30